MFPATQRYVPQRDTRNKKVRDRTPNEPLIHGQIYSITDALSGVVTKLRKSTLSFVISVCLTVHLSAWNNSTPTGQIFMKFDISVLSKSIQKFQVSLKSDMNNCTLHDDQHTFSILYRSILLRKRNVADIICRGNINAHFVFCDFFFRKLCRL